MTGRPPRSTLSPYPPLSRSLISARSPAASAERPPRPRPAASRPEPLTVVHRPTEQTHIVLGMRSIAALDPDRDALAVVNQDRKSTRLNSSHSQISYAVFCLK